MKPHAPLVLVSSRAPRSGAHGRRLGKLCARFLVQLGLAETEVSLSVVTDAEIQRINAQWRHKDQPTDVLSFPAGEQPLPPGARRPLGDLIVSLETARARAQAESRPLEEELARYVAHGLLHLLGHDHHADGEARRMARAERALLGGVGMIEAAGRVRAATARSRRAAPARAPRRPRSR